MTIWGHVELLCRAIAAQSREEAEQLLSRARVDAEALIAAARTAAEKHCQQAVQAARGQAYTDAKRRVDFAELEAKKRIMICREAIMREVLDTLDRGLQVFRNGPDYPAFLRDALAEALASLPGKVFIVQLESTDVDLLRGEIDRLNGDWGVHIEIETVSGGSGGLRVTTRDRRLHYDNTFAARRQRTENDIRREIWSAIFGNQSSTR